MKIKKRTENVNNNRQRLIFRGKINKSNTSLIIWLIFALLIVLIAVLADVIVPYDPYEQDLSAALMPPDSHHLLGTDQYGRDMLSRVIKGAGISLSSSFALVVIITLTGCIAGIISGYYGGIIDSIIMRLSDIFLAFPGLVFAIAVASVMSGGLVSAVIALALISWPKYARIARAEVLAIKNEPYIQVARMSGLNTIRILIKHIIPNIADIIIVTAVLDIGNMLERRGLIQDAYVFLAQSYCYEAGRKLVPGSYDLTTDMNAKEIMNAIVTQSSQTKDGE